MDGFWADLWTRLATTILLTPVAVALWKVWEELWDRCRARWRRRANVGQAALPVRVPITSLQGGIRTGKAACPTAAEPRTMIQVAGERAP